MLSDMASNLEASESRVTSYLFFNFPEKWEQVDCWRLFDRYGRVKDVYLARKLLSSGQRFGFVRFEGVSDIDNFAKTLNTIRINGRNLRAYKAMEKKKDCSGMITTSTVQRRSADSSDLKNKLESSRGLKCDERSFIEVVTGHKISSSSTINNVEPIQGTHYKPRNISPSPIEIRVDGKIFEFNFHDSVSNHYLVFSFNKERFSWNLIDNNKYSDGLHELGTLGVKKSGYSVDGASSCFNQKDSVVDHTCDSDSADVDLKAVGSSVTFPINSLVSEASHGRKEEADQGFGRDSCSHSSHPNGTIDCDSRNHFPHPNGTTDVPKIFDDFPEKSSNTAFSGSISNMSDCSKNETGINGPDLVTLRPDDVESLVPTKASDGPCDCLGPSVKESDNGLTSSLGCNMEEVSKNELNDLENGGPFMVNQLNSRGPSAKPNCDPEDTILENQTLGDVSVSNGVFENHKRSRFRHKKKHIWKSKHGFFNYIMGKRQTKRKRHRDGLRWTERIYLNSLMEELDETDAEDDVEDDDSYASGKDS